MPQQGRWHWDAGRALKLDQDLPRDAVGDVRVQGNPE